MKNIFDNYYHEDEDCINFKPELDKNDFLDGVTKLIIRKQHNLEKTKNLEKELIDLKGGIIKENLKKKIHFIKKNIEY